MGESVHKFEEEFAKYCGTDYAVSTSSGTHALQFSLMAAGMNPGDLCPDVRTSQRELPQNESFYDEALT